MIIKFLIELLLLGLSIFFICKFTNPVINTTSQIFAGVFGSAIIQSVITNWKYLQFLPRLVLLKLKGEKLRISFASLIRIKIGSKYLLVESKKTRAMWQPVGGVYKFFDTHKINSLKLKSDVGFTNSEPDEFRRTFSNEDIFKVFKLMRWFETQKGREISPNREYKEELIDTGFLDAKVFGSPNFQFLERFFDLSFADKFRVWELKIFEVFELVLSRNQEAELKNAVDAKPDKFLLLDQKYIESRGFVDDTTNYHLGDQTKYIL